MADRPRVLAIVPARAGSTRLPGKNLRTLGGIPLVVRSIEAARSAALVDTVVVSSDDEEVLALAEAIDPALVLRRPAELAGNESPAIDFVHHALAATSDRGPFDVVAIVQPTSPFTTGEDIDATLELLARSGAESAVTVAPLDHAVHPAKLKRLVGDRLVAYAEEETGRMAAHELPTLYARNCSVYASRLDILQQGRILGDDCRGLAMPRIRSIDINDEVDFAFAEFLWDRYLRPNSSTC